MKQYILYRCHGSLTSALYCVSARTGVVMAEFGHLYEQQYAVALFNKVRFDMEGGGGPQSQLLQRKVRDSLSALHTVILFSLNTESVQGGYITKVLSRVRLVIATYILVHAKQIQKRLFF